MYALAADSEEDLEEWMEALSKALGIEDEAVAGDGVLVLDGETVRRERVESVGKGVGKQ